MIFNPEPVGQSPRPSLSRSSTQHDGTCRVLRRYGIFPRAVLGMRMLPEGMNRRLSGRQGS